jgi:tetratricopeptide (TPR) repeat protein
LDLAAAEISYRSGLERALSWEGPQHVDILQGKARLGSLLMQAGRIEEGRRVLDEALDLTLRIKGRDDVIHTATVLALSRRALDMYGDAEEALARISQAVDIHRHAPRSPMLAFAQRLDWKAAFEIELGDYARAEDDLKESFAVWQQAGGLAAQFRNYVFAPRARMLLAQGRAREAWDFLNQFVQKDDGPAVMTRGGVEYAVVRCEATLALSLFDDARRIAAEARSKIENSTSRSYLKPFEARIALADGRALLLTGRVVEALPVLEHAVTLGRQVFDPERSLVLADMEVTLADCLARLGNTDRARALLVQAKRMHSAHANIGAQFVQSMRQLEARLR